MSKELIAKITVIAALMLLLLVPLKMISGLVEERQAKRHAVMEEIAQSSSGPQHIVGPVLVVPYRVKTVVQEEVLIHQNGQANTVVRTKDVFSDKVLTAMPQTLHIGGQVKTATLYRGLHQALTFTADTKIKGSFELDMVALASDPSVTIGEAYLAIGIRDVRGIRNIPSIDWQGKSLLFQPEARLDALGSGIHVRLPRPDFSKVGQFPFTLPLELMGTTALSFTPVGKDTRVQLAANWPHPSFFGQSLPTHRDVRSDGFTANWQTTWLNTERARTKDPDSKSDGVLTNHQMGVRFIQPVDEYQQAERALKYAILFVLLTFTGFFLFEMLKKLPIHPMQYALVGAALAMFYLLLIAISEHVEFAVAYAAASTACVVLIGFYLSFVLQHWQRGTGFAALLGVLYVTLYALLQSEDNALLLGALLMFGVLAGVMVLTRRLDWSRVAAPRIPPPPPVSQAI